MDVPLWIQVPRDVALRRRTKTKYCSQAYFDKCIWPNHERYEALVLSKLQSGVKIGLLDGTESMSLILSKAMVSVLQLGGAAAAALNAARSAADEAPGVFWKPDYSFRWELRRAGWGSSPACAAFAGADPAAAAPHELEPPRKLARLGAWPHPAAPPTA